MGITPENKQYWEDSYIGKVRFKPNTIKNPWDIEKHDPNLEWVMNELNIIPRNVLEVGCGVGNDSNWLSQLCTTVTGIDISSNAIDKANLNYGHIPNLKFICGDLNSSIPFSHYDLIYERGVLHNVDVNYYREFFTNYYSRLSIKGHVIILSGNENFYKGRDIVPPVILEDVIIAIKGLFKVKLLKEINFPLAKGFNSNLGFAWILQKL